MGWARMLLFRREAPGSVAATGLGARLARVLAALAVLPLLVAAGLAAGLVEDAAPPPVPAAVVPYYIAEAGESRGPLSLDLVLAEIGAGKVRPWTLVWKPGLSGWIRAGALPELHDALAEAVPQPPPPPPEPPPPPPDLPEEEIYFFAIGEEVRGPLSEDEIAAAIAAGSITRATLVWRQGAASWAAAWDIPALRRHFAETPPEVPPAEAMRQLMIGTWEFAADYGDGMSTITTIACRPDMTYSGFVTLMTPGAGPTTHAVSGRWSVTGAASGRFALTLTPNEGKPGTVQLRVVDADNLINETDGGAARRIAD